MQRKTVNTKYKLHSIPIINKVKSNVLYSIPCGCVLAFLLVVVVLLQHAENAYAEMVIGKAEDLTTISPISGGTTTPATASLSLSNTNMSQTAVPGSTATVSTNVTVSVDNADSYSLSLKVDSTILQNGSTTIVPGNPNDDTKTNVWGYKWDNASTYTAPSTTAQTLTVPALSNNAVSFTKNLTFGAKFSTDADAGHYKGSGTLSLVATPKVTTYTLADLTQMQQLAEGYAPDACKNTVIPSGQDYAGPYTLTDVRDNNTYTAYKFKDGKCWMTENLKLSNYLNASISFTEGRQLIPFTSDISTEWTLPASNASGFSSDAASNVYVSGNTGYYTWCAATAGTCSSATTNGVNASSSICPKGWKLPAGRVTGDNATNDFYGLFYNMNLSVKNNLSASGTNAISWGSGDLAIVQGSPYNFAYTGYMNSSGLQDNSSEGSWWSRTVSPSNYVYYLYITRNVVCPGTYWFNRQLGRAVRCVAE